MILASEDLVILNERYRHDHDSNWELSLLFRYDDLDLTMNLKSIYLKYLGHLKFMDSL